MKDTLWRLHKTGSLIQENEPRKAVVKVEDNGCQKHKFKMLSSNVEVFTAVHLKYTVNFQITSAVLKCQACQLENVNTQVKVTKITITERDLELTQAKGDL